MLGDCPVIVKLIRPSKSKKIKREIFILNQLRGGPNVIDFFGAYIDTKSHEPALVFAKVENIDWKELYPKMSKVEINYYAFELLRALDFAHSRGIMHRDVKPQNISIDPVRHEVRFF
ncbi:kinase-like domain-containing protein, partial [Blyttiomyces helicus]